MNNELTLKSRNGTMKNHPGLNVYVKYKFIFKNGFKTYEKIIKVLIKKFTCKCKCKIVQPK